MCFEKPPSGQTARRCGSKQLHPEVHVGQREFGAWWIRAMPMGTINIGSVSRADGAYLRLVIPAKEGTRAFGVNESRIGRRLRGNDENQSFSRLTLK